VDSKDFEEFYNHGKRKIYLRYEMSAGVKMTTKRFFNKIGEKRKNV
jgi:sulfur relay (sulfurtransferase) DsrC/TusE family protein